MASTYHLEVVTPDRAFFDGDVEMIIVRTTEGDMGIMKNHEPTVAPVSIGAIRIKVDGQFMVAAVAGGFVSVDEERTTVVTDAAEWVADIDIDRAKAALERAKKRLEMDSTEIDVLRAKMAVAKATNRIRLFGSKMDHSNL